MYDLPPLESAPNYRIVILYAALDLQRRGRNAQWLVLVGDVTTFWAG